MHCKILCITTDINDEKCPISEEDFYSMLSGLGADYGGENCPDDVEPYFHGLLSDFCTIKYARQSQKEDSDITYKILFDQELARQYVVNWFNAFKQVVAETTIESIFKDDYHSGRDLIERSLSRNISFNSCIYFDYELMSPIDFAIRLLKVNQTKPLYINGCVDYHW